MRRTSVSLPTKQVRHDPHEKPARYDNEHRETGILEKLQGTMNQTQKARWLKTTGIVVFFVFLFYYFSPKGIDIYQKGVSSHTDGQVPADSSYGTTKCTKSYSKDKPIVQYVLMIDAGSTGSRIHVYKFNNCGPTPELESEEFKMTEKSVGGLSKYKDDPLAAAKTLDPLMAVAMQTVPDKLKGCSPVAVKATAGLRMIGADAAEKILETVRHHLENDYPFPVVSKEENGVAIMDGSDEGVYAWVTTNYLLGKIGGPDDSPTAAVFDLGGGSTQIVFEPTFKKAAAGGMPEKLAEGDHKYELSFGGRDFELYQHSHLGYGLMAARNAIHQILLQDLYSKNKDKGFMSKPILNPCINAGQTDIVKVKLDEDSPLGSGEVELNMTGPAIPAPAQCRALAERILAKDAECKLAPCSFNGVHQPSLAKTFATEDVYIFSYFFDRTKPLGMPDSFTLRELHDLTNTVCNGEEAWDVFSTVPGALEELRDRGEHCLDLNFMLALLHTGYEMPIEREVKIAKKIKGNELGWCLGASLPLLSKGSGWSCKITECGFGNSGKESREGTEIARMSVASFRSSASTPSLRSRDGLLPAHLRPDNGANVRVVVRVRAFLPREIKRGADCLISMDPRTQRTTLHVPNDTDPANARSKSRKVIEEKSFTFDNSFWSHDRDDPHYATQEDVYNSLGEEFLDHNFEGYHTCIFAYGQTGSGKSYTMMGTPDQPGLIPRTCEDLFQRIEAAQSETPNISYHVRASYFEVYNEHVRDLLVPAVPNQPPYYLKIRESPTEGPYVKDLTEVPVRSLNEILRYMQAGDANRTVASTKMNDTSSRSHAVFTIMLKQIHHDMETDETTERSSRIRLVDLAGSERAKATEATGTRLREGSNINKSLTTLGRVIAALADPKHHHRPSGNRGLRRDVVPYRDSILTWLLKDSLGGNSKTAMIACIAPSDYEETLSTLRYADQAKRIRTRAVVNQEDHVSAAQRDAQLSAMADEIRRLQLSVGESRRREARDAQEAEDRLDEYQAQVTKMQRLMEEQKLVAESKIRSLQTENEALRLHLKLALDSIKNPIPEVVAATAEQVGGDAEGGTDDRENVGPADGEGDVGMGGKGGSRRESLVDEAYFDEDDGYSSEAYEEKANDVQDYMHELLKDLSLFRRKIGDDKDRFLDESWRQLLASEINV
ncbi:hypothetical protein DL771_001428 [Monosporascus sp. 5C6A]|nr:hypothetical protein DL771_001428 [Monosporascus sp. 5C6A]